MEIVGGIILAIFVGILLFVSLTFGLVILGLCVAAAALMALLVVAEKSWRRWRFVQSATRNERGSAPVIEGEYTNISDKQKETL